MEPRSYLELVPADRLQICGVGRLRHLARVERIIDSAVALMKSRSTLAMPDLAIWLTSDTMVRSVSKHMTTPLECQASKLADSDSCSCFQTAPQST